MTRGAPVRVLLVDDHSVMRAGFRTILESAGGIEVVGEAATGVEAVAAASALHPDVICMDVQMPDMDGIAATRKILADPDAGAAIVVVTTFDRDDYLFEALSSGASGFLLKNAGPEELVSAVRVAAAGDALLAPEVTRRVIERFARADADAAAPAHGTGAVGASPAHGTGAVGASPAHGTQASGASPGPARAAPAEPAPAPEAELLTEREAEVLRLLAQALSNAEIAARLYIGEATVKTHVSNVLLKLGVRDRVAAVVYAHRHGLA
ncbi:response regulator [Microbacterium sp.]|uniref:response regulator n=1 Tax=Microbacterium sp. TaxID=51671 RepID=UPI0039E627A2